MTGLNSWLSPAVLHALGWALIHSLWQCAAAGALAMLAMAFIRRPSVRYAIGVGALALMLAAPLATFLVLVKPAAPVQAPRPVTTSVLPAGPVFSTAYPAAALAGADRAIAAIAEAPRQLPLPDILPWLVGAWACGVAVFSLRFAGGFLLLEHRRRTQSHVPGDRVLALCQGLQHQLGLDRAIQYLECGWVQAPAVIGWLRPAVLLPVFALTGLSEEQFKAVIAHELAHIRRHDWFVNLFQVLVETLLFYHPAMWWLNRRIRIERELCCDEIAVSLTGSRLEYARALTQMAEWKNVSLLAMAANRGPLTQRILYVLGRKPSGAGQRVAGLTGGVLFLTAALAAANLLFGITYPIPAKAEIRAVLVSSQSAALRLARQVFPVSGPAARIAAPQIAPPNNIETASGSKPENITAPSPDLSRLLPSQSLATPTVVASNAAPATPQPSPNAAMALNDQPGMQPTARDLSVGSAQAGLSSPPAAPAESDLNEPDKITECGEVPHGSVTGRVTSSTTIQMPKFACGRPGGGGGGAPDGGAPTGGGPGGKSVFNFNSGPCANPVRGSISLPWGNYCPNTPDAPWLTVTVQLANPADASKMPLGKLVTLRGDFFVITKNQVHYLIVKNARVLYVDPFDRQVGAEQPGKMAGLAGDAHITRGDSTDHVSLAALQSPSPARGRAELALKCWLGLVEYKGCWKGNGCNGGVGPVEKVEYLGAAATGADVYQVRYRFRIAAYMVAPDPGGKRGEYLVKPTDHYWIKREISPPAAPVLIYTRPEDAPPAGCDYYLGVETLPPPAPLPGTTP